MLRRTLFSFKHLSCSSCSSQSLQCATYKSVYNIENIYSRKVADLSKTSKHPVSNGEGFSGFIPVEELDIKFVRGSGPGGQNVNKVNTKVEVRFHVESAKWIPEAAKQQLLTQARNKINSDGFLVVTSEKTRKQILNQADCMEKIRTMVFEAAKPPYEPTEEDLSIISAKKEKARQNMLREKKERSLKKASRQKPSKYSLL